MNVWSVWENAFHNKAWSNLGSSYENKDSEKTCWIGEKKFDVNFFACNDLNFDETVSDANERVLATAVDPTPGPDAPNSCAAAMTRLSSLYQDSLYGPKYFHENAQLVKHLLFIYKFTKDANNYSMFYLKRSRSGICIYFNTFTKMRVVVIPVGIDGLEPVKIGVQEFRIWYKEQRQKAKLRRILVRKELLLLGIQMETAELEKNDAFESLEKIEKKRKRLQMTISSRYTDFIDRSQRYNVIVLENNTQILELQEELLENIKKQKEFLRNRGMYEEKEFLKKMTKELRAGKKILTLLHNLESEMFGFLTELMKVMRKECRPKRTKKYNFRTN